jgi:hypothetical protein
MTKFRIVRRGVWFYVQEERVNKFFLLSWRDIGMPQSSHIDALRWVKAEVEKRRNDFEVVQELTL